tara:strand:+ start:665 stop:1294 length:630 start_codon:yes stop_codon:yes gene_type:complete
MLTQLFDLLTYSTLTAGLVAQMMVAPDAAFVLGPSSVEVLTDEIIEVTLTLKANTPVESISAALTYDPTVLTLNNTNAESNFNLSKEESNTPGSVFVAADTDEPNTAVGIHPTLTFTFNAVAPGTTSVHVQNLYASTPEDKIINTVQYASTTIAVLARENSLDLNADNTHTLADIGLFLAHFATQNPSADFNNDRRVTPKDLRILLRAY